MKAHGTDDYTLHELYKLLENYDYTYTFSDDHRVWKRGEAQAKEIKTAVNQLGLAGKQLRDSFFYWYQTGSDPEKKPQFESLMDKINEYAGEQGEPHELD